MKKHTRSEELSANVASPPPEPTLQQWEKLYETAAIINQMAPWEFLWDTNLVTIMLPGHEEPVYCSVMGRLGECYGIGVYPGYEAFMGYQRLLSTRNTDNLAYLAGFEQKCLACYYGDREELSPKERTILKKLGIKFRGRNEWVYFRTMQPGFIPWVIDAHEADLLIQVLENFVMAIRSFSEDNLKVDFDNGETLLRYYSPEEGQWVNKAEKMPPPPAKLHDLVIKDDLLVARLKNKKKNTTSLEVEATYLPTPIQERKNDKPFLPRLVLITDRKSGLPLSRHVAQPKENIEEIIVKFVSEHIEKNGRPSTIYVRNEYVGRYIENLCKKLEIKMISGEEMYASNAILKKMLRFI